MAEAGVSMMEEQQGGQCGRNSLWGVGGEVGREGHRSEQ